MKKVCILVLSILLLLSLCACAESQQTQQYTVEKNRRTYTVDPVAKTIFDGYEVFRYTFSGNTEEYQFQVTYPDGSTWSWTKKDGAESGGGSEDYSGMILANGPLLRDIVLEGQPTPIVFGDIWPSILAIGFGVLSLLKPRIPWFFLAFGWAFKDSEPSKLALVIFQIIGGLLIIGGILAFFPLLFG